MSESSPMRQWVMLAPISNNAKTLYALLTLYVQPGDTPTVRVSRSELAALMRLKKADSVDKHIKELVAVGAVEKVPFTQEDGGNGPNAFLLPQDPPEGHEGPQTLAAWHAARYAEQVEKMRSRGYVENPYRPGGFAEESILGAKARKGEGRA